MPKLHCVPVPVPACPCTVLAIPSCYQTSLDCAGRNTTSSSPEQLISDSWRWAKPVSPHDSEKGMVFPKCVILNQYPCGSSGLPNPIEGFGDATLWRSCVPRYRPQRQPMTRQLNNEFQVGFWLAWLPLCFEIAIYAQREHTADCIWYKCDTLFLEQLEKSTLLRNELIGPGQNRRWTVKFCKGGGGSLKIAGGTLMILTQISTCCGEKGRSGRWFYIIGEQCKKLKKSKQFFPRNAKAYFSTADNIFLSWFSSGIRYMLSFQSSFFALR